MLVRDGDSGGGDSSDGDSGGGDSSDSGRTEMIGLGRDGWAREEMKEGRGRWRVEGGGEGRRRRREATHPSDD